MSYVIPFPDKATQTRPVRLAAAAAGALGALLQRVAARRRHAAARREFDRLDAATVRDLGMSRGEFDSYWAETQGLAEATRIRVPAAQGQRGAS